MHKKIKDLVVKTGSYTDRGGQTKNRYKNIGSVLQMDDGSKMILMDRSFNPAGVPYKDGSDQIIISMFDPRPDQAATPSAAPSAAPAPAADFDDDMPF